MKDIFHNKFTDQVTLTHDYLVPEISSYLISNEKEIQDRAKKIIESAKEYNSYNAFEKLMHEYDLSSSEGIVLMCLAEALLRIPDNKTINDLIEDKIPSGKWKDHIKNDNNIFVNISSIAFLMTGKILKQDELKETDIFISVLKNISKPVLRSVIKQSINILAKQFIFEKDIKRASKLSSKLEGSIYAYSFDMLGEGARTYDDADKYFENYKNAIKVIGESSTEKKHSISIKLSAIHPRYERSKLDLLRKELLPKLFELIELAKKVNVDICFDAEEADRLNLSLFMVEEILNSNVIDNHYSGFGIAVQAYQQRSMFILKWLDTKLKKLNKKKINLKKTKFLRKELLKPTKIYVKEVLNLIKNNLINGCANITGGGLSDNIKRVMPDGLTANINLNIAVLTGLSDKNSFKDLNCMVVDDLKSIEVDNVK